MRLDLPDDAAVCDVSTIGLPTDWPTNEGATQALGINWLLSGSSLGLWVPSFIERSETNLLINPAHTQYTSIRLTVERNPFKFDPRLF